MLRIVAPKVTMLAREVPKLAIVFNFWRAIKSFCHRCLSKWFPQHFCKICQTSLEWW